MRYVIYFILIITGLSANAQPYFTHVDTSNIGSPGVIKTNTGFVTHTGKYLSSGLHVSIIEVRDELGEITQTYLPYDTVFLSQPYSPVCLLLLSDSSCLVIGYQDTSVSVPGYEMISIVKKFTKDHNEVWTKTFFGEYYVHGFNQLIELSNGDFAMVGFVNHTQNEKSQAALAKFDSNFDLIEVFEFGNADTDLFQSIVEVEGVGLYVSGREYILQSDGWVVTLRLIDYNGNLVWKKIYSDGFQKQHIISKIILLKDYTIFNLIQEQPYFNALSRKTFAKKISLDGEVIYTVELDNTLLLDDALRSLKEFSDGSIACGGIGKSLSSNDQTINLIKIDPLGNTMWERAYEFDPLGYDIPYEFDFVNDNNLLFTGSYSTPNNVQCGILMQMNCNGEEGAFYTVNNNCDYYDCTQYPMSTTFTASKTFIDLSQENGWVFFENDSPNTISREWHMDDGTVYYTADTLSHEFIYNGIHHVKLISNHGVCTDTTWMDIEVVNGINATEEEVFNDLKIYPNPATDIVHVKSTQPITSIKLQNAMGQLVDFYFVNQVNFHFEVKDYNPGIYYLTVLNKDGSSNFRKLIIE